MSSSNPQRFMPASRLLGFLLLILGMSMPVMAQEHMSNFGTPGFEMSMEMTPTSDGNYVTVSPVIRFNTTAGPQLKIYLNKIDDNSDVIWSRKIGQMPTNNQPGNQLPLSVVEMVDAAGTAIGYAITGYNLQVNSPDPIFIVTTDLNGHVLQFRTYGGVIPIPGANIAPVRGVGNKIIQNHQGELVVVGSILLTDNVGIVPFMLNVNVDLGLNFMRLYHDVRFFNNLFGFGSGVNFDDIVVAPPVDDPQTGAFLPEGYLITGGTRQMNPPGIAETLVVRTDLGGNPLKSGLYGPTFTDSKGRAIELTSTGLVKVVSHVVEVTGAPLSTQIFTLEPVNLNLIHQHRYHGFISHGDIRETMNGEFILAGRGAFDNEGAVLRIKNNGNIIFYYGYGSTNVEILTDAHELFDGTIFSSGVTTTWCYGPADEYIVRTLPDGTLPGCPVHSLNIDRSTPQDPPRITDMITVLVDLNLNHEVADVTPDTIKRRICPGPIVIGVPWDWFRRADFTRDQQINVADPIGSLDKLFSGGPEAIPAAAADANGDGVHDISDVIYTLSYLFSGGVAPTAPFEQVGPDPEQTEPNLFGLSDFFEYFGSQMRGGDQRADLYFLDIIDF
ncbi:MAG: hypothetical protein GWP38_02380 [Planctomycetia bacterium]|nr:hypothetical protein [Planctomycetia bacterium]